MRQLKKADFIRRAATRVHISSLNVHGILASLRGHVASSSSLYHIYDRIAKADMCGNLQQCRIRGIETTVRPKRATKNPCDHARYIHR